MRFEDQVMASLFWVLMCLMLAASTAADSDTESDQQKFLVVAPRRLLAGKHEKIWVSYTGDKHVKKFPVTINLLKPESNETLASVTYEYSTHEHDAHLAVPASYLGRATLEVVAGSGDQEIRRSAQVDLEHSEALTFIETDRPFYKPGELVRMRFLLLQHKLQPVTDGISTIWVENPARIRMAQWQNVQTYNGLAQVEMQLSEEPVQGNWNIKLQANNISTVVVKSFEVKEYVLPKFEVIITPPEYITFNSEDVNWNICAKYSYGKPVQGNVDVNITFESPYFHWYGRHAADISLSHFTHSGELKPRDGCQNFTVSKEVLQLQRERHAFSILIQASVEEAGTGEVQVASQKSEIHRDETKIKFIKSPAYFKPYLPYHGKLRVTLRNGKPLEGKEVKLVLKLKKTSHSPWVPSWNLPHQDTKNFTSDSNGFISFIIPPQVKEVHTLVLEASINSAENEHVFDSLEVKQWYSPSDSYLQVVDHSYQPLKCGSSHGLSIMYTYDKNTTKSIKFIYLIQSKGDIMKQIVHEEHVRDAKIRPELRASKNNITLGKLPAQDKMLPVGRWNLKLEVSTNMSPLSQLLVYYIRPDGEIVASSHTLNIKECLKHKVNTRFSHEQVQPGAKVSFKVTPESRSFCAISAVDKAVTFLSGDHALTQRKVFEQLKQFDIGPASYDGSDYQPCFQEYPIDRLPIPMPLRAQPRGKRMIMQHFSIGYGNTKQAFSDAGMVIISNLETNHRPCSKGNQENRGPCNPCPLAYPRFRGPIRVPASANLGLEMSHARSRNSDFMRADAAPEAPVYKGTKTVEPPLVEIRSLFPETWLWNLEQFDGPEEKSFDLETPHSITDWIVNTVCVSVADGLGIAPPTSIKVFKPYFMDFTLPYSIKRGEILPLKVSLFNYLNHDLPVRITFTDFTGGSLLSESTYSACLGEHTSLVHEFKLEPTGLGEHNITVTANVDSDFPTVCGPELLMDARDGLMKKIIVKPEGFPEDITNSAFICLSDGGEQAALSWDFSLPENLVEGSDRAFISVIGDVMGPSLENLDGLVQLPMGCGEQNMILFVPNILVLNYLNSSDQYYPQLSNKAVSHMKKGYQRELTYRHSDGSYSAFGKSDPEGSLWLTAFVVKSFAQAKKYIFVDVNDLKLSTSWIINKQLENGCFPFVGKVFHKDMKGGLGDDSSTTALSAYVLISLMETDLEEINDKIISNAVYCMLGKEEQDVYTLALSTYALTLVHQKHQNLVSREQIDKNLQLLMSYAITNNSELRFEKPESKSLALNLEITAYVILTLTSLGGEDNLLHALNAVRWISKHRNANGGFVSTQDTVVALEALAKYAVSVPNKNISMEILSTTSSEDWSQEFSLTTENQLVLQQSTLPKVPTSIHFLMKGQGCALVQSNLRYNVKNAYPSEAFNLIVQVSPVTGRSCSRLLLELEVAYNLVDGESNMAVIEVDMLSGYVPVKTSLDVLLLNTAVKLKRWDESNGQVNLYFDSLTSESKSLSFLLEQAVEVENPKPSQVRVFDYYTPELSISTSYGLEDLKCFLEFLPEPIAVDESTTSPPVAETRSVSNTQAEIEAADEPDGDKAPKDPFENFTNVDHDLEFPDGNEGVEPVLVPAPLQAVTEQLPSSDNQSSTLSASCPTCYNDIQLSEFTSLYCSAETVLKLSMRSNKKAKLLSDISPNKTISRINKNASLSIDQNCNCEILNKEGNHILVLIFSKTDTPLTTVTKPAVHLEQGIHVVGLKSTSGNKATSNLLYQAKRLC